jgi:hypothetical protein
MNPDSTEVHVLRKVLVGFAALFGLGLALAPSGAYADGPPCGPGFKCRGAPVYRPHRVHFSQPVFRPAFRPHFRDVAVVRHYPVYRPVTVPVYRRVSVPVYRPVTVPVPIYRPYTTFASACASSCSCNYASCSPCGF